MKHIDWIDPRVQPPTFTERIYFLARHDVGLVNGVGEWDGYKWMCFNGLGQPPVYIHNDFLIAYSPIPQGLPDWVGYTGELISL